MDERISIIPTLPLPNGTPSYWQDPPDAEVASFQSVAKFPLTADCVVVGSGISGTCISWFLLEKPPQLQGAMLEAREACSGATGRNGKLTFWAVRINELI